MAGATTTAAQFAAMRKRLEALEARTIAADAEIAKTKAKADAEIAKAKATAKAAADAEIATAKAAADAEIATAKAAADAEMATAKAIADAEIAKAKAKADAEIAKVKVKADAEIAKAKAAESAQKDVLKQAVAAARAVTLEAVARAAVVSASGYAQDSWPEHQGLEFDTHGVGRWSTKRGAAYLCGRPHRASAPLPAALVSDAFVAFLDVWHDVDDADIPAPMLAVAHELCVVMCTAYKREAQREAAALIVLSQALGREVKPLKGVVSTDGTVLHYTRKGFKPMMLNLEIKNFYTAAQGDAYMQNVQYFAKYNNRADAARLPVPAFLVTIVDNVLTVSAAYYDVQPCCQPLIPPVWLMHTPGTDEGELTVARVLLALREGVNALEAWYRKQPPAILVPERSAATSYALPLVPTMESGVVRLIDYLIPERRSTLLYRGTYTKLDGTVLPVAVKFVQRYGVDAHRAAASYDLAPALLECVDAHHGWKMIVMELLDVPTWTTLRSLIDATTQRERGIEAAKNLLARFKSWRASKHGEGFVHGDLHQKNVLVTTAGKIQIRVVDWDWSSRHRSADAVYPPFVNQVSHAWAPGVESGASMELAHDDYLIKLAISGRKDVTPPASPAVSPEQPRKAVTKKARYATSKAGSGASIYVEAEDEEEDISESSTVAEPVKAPAQRARAGTKRRRSVSS